MKRAGSSMKSVVVAGLVFAYAAVALGDPLPGHDIPKFSQKPLAGTVLPDGSTYFGHDEFSTAYASYDATGAIAGYKGTFMADDFADNYDTPVVHITWWGSYLNNDIYQPVDKFLIAFESDVPASDNPAGFSAPGSILSSQIVKRAPLSPGSGTFTEAAYNAGGPPLNEAVYQYNAELAVPFDQKPDTVYWLKIVALVDPPPDTADPFTRWGWHDRDWTTQDTLASALVAPGEGVIGAAGNVPVWHFQDDAVTGSVLLAPSGIAGVPVVDQDPTTFQPTHYLDDVDGPAGIGAYSKDLAFVLYTPEPASLALLAIGGLAILRRRRDR